MARTRAVPHSLCPLIGTSTCQRRQFEFSLGAICPSPQSQLRDDLDRLSSRLREQSDALSKGQSESRDHANRLRDAESRLDAVIARVDELLLRLRDIAGHAADARAASAEIEEEIRWVAVEVPESDAAHVPESDAGAFRDSQARHKEST